MISKEEKEVGSWEGGKDPQRPTATTLHLHRELKFE